MVPVIEDFRPELRFNGLDRRQCYWHVRYRFCDLSAEIAVYAENEAQARAQAVRQLRPAWSESRVTEPRRFPPPWSVEEPDPKLARQW